MTPTTARWAWVFASLAAVSVPAMAAGPALAMLDSLSGGEWELRVRGTDAAPERMCIRGVRSMIQLRHPGVGCSQIVVNDTPGEITVQYTCRGQGYGRTHIRRENDRLVQIDSQGIVNGRPFAFAGEARSVVQCRT